MGLLLTFHRRASNLKRDWTGFICTPPRLLRQFETLAQEAMEWPQESELVIRNPLCPAYILQPIDYVPEIGVIHDIHLFKPGAVAVQRGQVRQCAEGKRLAEDRGFNRKTARVRNVVN